MTVPTSFVVVVGGDDPAAGWVPSLPAGSVVVAADSGVHAALAAGIHVHHVIGDLDSVRPAALAKVVANGAEVHRYPADKDVTDGELALELARQLAAPPDGAPAEERERPQLLVLGGGGGRLDHLLADLLALATPRLAVFDVAARIGLAAVTVVRAGPPRHLAGAIGEQVSLLPVHGRARGVTTSGLRWPLVNADLVVGTTRAVSNEFVRPEAEVSLDEGVLLVVQPGTAAGAIEPRSTPYDPTPRNLGGVEPP